MASHYGGKCAAAKIPEFGKMELVLDDPTGGQILAGLPQTSIVWESHNDEVIDVPASMRTTAHSKSCAVQAIEHKRSRATGIQFHPEVEHTHKFGEQIFRNFIGLCKK